MVRWPHVPDNVDESRVHDQTSSEEKGVPQAKAQEASPDFRSKTEARWWGKLQTAEGIARKYYEPMSLRIGPKRNYRPDFKIVRTDGGIEVVELKGGYTWDRSLVKPSAAAMIYPHYDWLVVQQKSKGSIWTLEWKEPNRETPTETVTERLVDEINL